MLLFHKDSANIFCVLVTFHFFICFNISSLITETTSLFWFKDVRISSPMNEWQMKIYKAVWTLHDMVTAPLRSEVEQQGRVIRRVLWAHQLGWWVRKTYCFIRVTSIKVRFITYEPRACALSLRFLRECGREDAWLPLEVRPSADAVGQLWLRVS